MRWVLLRKYLVLKCNKDGESSYVSPFRKNVFSENEAECYFKNVLKCFYVDLEFYQLQDIGENSLVYWEFKENCNWTK